MDNQLTLQQKKRKVQDFRPIDDVFFEVLANDVSFEACKIQCFKYYGEGITGWRQI